MGGEDHKTGQADDAGTRYALLEQWTRERFPMATEVRFRWSGQIMVPVDGLAFIGRNPHYRVLFGPVSITNEYREASRCMILASMRQTCMEDSLKHLVKPKFPPKPPRRSEWCLEEYAEYINDIDQVAEYVAEIEPDGNVCKFGFSEIAFKSYRKLSYGTFDKIAKSFPDDK